MALRAVSIITFRGTSAARIRNLRYVLAWLDQVPNVSTLVIEQDQRQQLDQATLPASCRVIFARNAGPFNKSWGFNVGWRAADADVLVFSDADMLIGREQLRAAIDACTNGHEVVRPWSEVVDLTEPETQSLLAGTLDASSVNQPARLGRGGAGEVAPLCGGLYVTRRDVYERLGGQDERFCGWGGEDDAMSMKVGTLCSRVALMRNAIAYHLHHPRHASLPVNDENYQENLALLREYKTYSRGMLAQLCDDHRSSMGHADRYA